MWCRTLVRIATAKSMADITVLNTGTPGSSAYSKRREDRINLATVIDETRTDIRLTKSPPANLRSDPGEPQHCAQLCTFANKPGMISISFSPYSYFWPSILGAFVRRCCCDWRAFTHCSMVKCCPSLVRSLSFKPRRLSRGLLEMGSKTTWLLGL
jgi:hypothetical protein